MKKRLVSLLLALALTLSLCPVLVFADSPVVAKIGEKEYTSLQTAVSEAVAGQTVDIVLAGTYAIPSPIDGVTISGTKGGGKEQVIFDASKGQGQLGSTNGEVTFSDVTFTFGNAGYTGFQHPGKITFSNCVLNGYFQSYGTMVFTDCTFNQTEKNYSMWCYAGDVTYTRCVFNEKRAALNLYNEGNNAKDLSGKVIPWVITVEDCTFTHTGGSDTEYAAILLKTIVGNVSDARCKKIGYKLILKGTNTASSTWKGTKASGYGGTGAHLVGSVPGLVWVQEASSEISSVLEGDKQVWPAPVAKIGDNGYGTVSAALTAAEGNAEIQILADAELQTGITVKSGVLKVESGKFTAGSFVVTDEAALGELKKLISESYTLAGSVGSVVQITEKAQVGGTDVVTAPAETQTEDVKKDDVETIVGKTGLSDEEKTEIAEALNSMAVTGDKALAAQAAESAGTLLDGVDVSDAKTKLASDEITLVIEPYLTYEVTDYDPEEKTVTMDIDAYYVVKATTDPSNMTELNTVTVIEEEKLEVKKPVSITVTLPNGFAKAGDPVYIIHDHAGNKYYYAGTVAADGKTLTFVNEKGFSDFTFSLEKSAVLKEATDELEALIEKTENKDALEILKKTVDTLNKAAGLTEKEIKEAAASAKARAAALPQLQSQLETKTTDGAKKILQEAIDTLKKSELSEEEVTVITSKALSEAEATESKEKASSFVDKLLGFIFLMIDADRIGFAWFLGALFAIGNFFLRGFTPSAK